MMIKPKYKFMDEFSTALAAGSVNNSLMIPGPGNRTVVDTESKLSIADGKLTFAGGKTTPAYGDPGAWENPVVTRAAGVLVAFKFKVNDVTNVIAFGLDTDKTGEIAGHRVRVTGDTMQINDGVTAGPVVAIPVDGMDYVVVFALRAAGCKVYRKVGTGYYEFLWSTTALTTATLYAGVANYSATAFVDFIRAINYKWLSVPLLSDSFTGAAGTMDGRMSDGLGHLETSGIGSGGVTAWAGTNGAVDGSGNLVITPTVGAELNSGDIVVGNWYLITATQANFFFTGCAVGNTFRCATAKTLSADNKVKLITLSTCSLPKTFTTKDIFVTETFTVEAGKIAGVIFGLSVAGTSFVRATLNGSNFILEICEAGTYTVKATIANTAVTAVTMRIRRTNNAVTGLSEIWCYVNDSLMGTGPTTTLSFPENANLSGLKAGPFSTNESCSFASFLVEAIGTSNEHSAIERLVSTGINAVAYGVVWDTSATTPQLKKGFVDSSGIWALGSDNTNPIQSKMKRCVLNASGTKLYNLDSTNSIYKEGFTTPLTTGTASSTSGSHLVDATADFVTAGVVAGMWVENYTTNNRALITNVTATDLTLSENIFTSGNSYRVGTANPQADGAVFVEVPAFHYIWVEDGVNTYILQSESSFTFIKPSNGTVVNSELHPWFTEGGVTSQFKYISAFESIWYKSAISAYANHDGATVGVSGDKAVSLPGYKPLTYQYRRSSTAYTGFAGLHNAFGAAYNSQGFFAYEALWILMTVEYASLAGQTYLPGYTDASAWLYAYTRKTGRTMGLGNISGSIAVELDGRDSDLTGILSAGKYIANSYRGIENIYGHIFKWIDGINSNWVGTGSPMTSNLVYLSNNPSQWAEDTNTNYQSTGLSFPLSPGYASALHPGRLLTKSASGGNTTYLCDYFYIPVLAGWRGLYSGGSLGSGADAGPASLAAYGSGSGFHYAGIGGRAAA